MTTSTAEVRVRIDPRGLATTYRIEYGPTTSYGSQTPPAPAGSATTEVVLTQTLTGLAPYTAYHYRVVATSSGGTTFGRDETLTTAKVPLALSASVKPGPVVFDRPLLVSGVLSGSANAGQDVVLQGNQFPYTHGFGNLAGPLPTDSSGAFSFPLKGLLASTRLRVVLLAKSWIASPIVTEPVEVAVTLHARPTHRRGFIELFGTATPARAGKVAFERMNRRHHRYVTVGGTTLHPSAHGTATFSRTIRVSQRGLYRALVVVPKGPEVSGRSRALRLR